MPAIIDPETLHTLCETFDVSHENARFFGDFYHDKILPRIQSKYLAHLTISIEEMIDEKLREQSKGKSNENNAEEDQTGEKMRRKFSIILLCTDKLPSRLKLPPGTSKAVAIPFTTKCALICYEPTDDTRKLRIYIAHELGHLLYHYNIFHGQENVENHANTFAYFAISGKNKFYQEKVKKLNLIYQSEIEIINSIQDAYTIKGEWQEDHGPLNAGPK